MCECINGDGLDCHENPVDECDCEEILKNERMKNEKEN